jgi:hypothetical protein
MDKNSTKESQRIFIEIYKESCYGRFSINQPFHEIKLVEIY